MDFHTIGQAVAVGKPDVKICLRIPPSSHENGLISCILAAAHRVLYTENRVHASSPKGYLAIEKTTSQTILYSRRMKDRLDSPIHPPF